MALASQPAGNWPVDCGSGLAHNRSASAEPPKPGWAVACAAALAAIDVFETDDLAGRARDVEAILTARLGELQASDPRIGDIRGRGAMIAIEFVDPATSAPDSALAAAVAKACIAEGVIVLTCGTYGNVIRFLPPLPIPDDLLREGLDVVAAALAAL